MPVYEYYCKQCGSKFELLRSMSRADEPARCPQGHQRAERTLSVFAAIGRTAEGESLPPSGGGCACGGGGCACGH
jgi:putative FmdB family regulatory protein